MPTDDERREVVENLRYAADYPGHIVQYMEQFINMLREVIFSDVCSGADYSEMFQRLADLIEPSCDRDELMALADELEDKAQFARASTKHAVIYAGYAREYESFARRIREACGEVAS